MRSSFVGRTDDADSLNALPLFLVTRFSSILFAMARDWSAYNRSLSFEQFFIDSLIWTAVTLPLATIFSVRYVTFSSTLSGRGTVILCDAAISWRMLNRFSSVAMLFVASMICFVVILRLAIAAVRNSENCSATDFIKSPFDG